MALSRGRGKLGNSQTVVFHSTNGTLSATPSKAELEGLLGTAASKQAGWTAIVEDGTSEVYIVAAVANEYLFAAMTLAT